MNRIPQIVASSLAVILTALCMPVTAHASNSSSLAASPSTNLSTNALASTELSSGAMTATLPIAMPTARGIAQPNLSISYNSFAGLREAGVSWGLNLPSIERKNLSGPPRYNDPASGAALDPKIADRFEFQGSPLVPVCFISDEGGCSNAPGEPMPTWAIGGWHYFRLQIDGTFARFFWSPNHQTWRVQFPSGETMELGIPLVSPLEPEEGLDSETSCRPNTLCSVETAPTGTCAREVCSAPPYRWNVVRRWDTQTRGGAPSNLVVYRWRHFGHLGIGFLAEVFDTPPENANSPLSTFAHHALLGWESHFNPDISAAPIWRSTPDLRLATITVTSMPFAGGSERELVRRYHLSYDSTRPARSLLRTFQVEGRCDSPIAESQLATAACPTLPPTTLDYTSAPDFNAFVKPWGVPFPQGALPPALGVRIADFNADGLPDIFVSDGATPTISVYLNNADPNGLMDIQPVPLQSLTSPPIAPYYVPNNAQASDGLDECDQGDFLGNGRITFVCRVIGGPTRGATLTPIHQGTSWSLHSWPFPDPTLYPHIVDPGFNALDLVDTEDFDGDGYVDALNSWTTSKNAIVAFTLKNPDGTIDPFHTQWTGYVQTAFQSPGPYKYADVNGDGLVDRVVANAEGNIVYYAGNGYGNFDASTASMPMELSNVEGRLWVNTYFHDLNGDGFADLILVDRDGIVVRNNNGHRGFYPAATIPSWQIPIWHDQLANFAYSNKLAYPQVEFADMLGAGSDDIVLRSGTLFATISTIVGTRPGLLKSIDNGIGATTQITYDSTTNIAAIHKQAKRPWTVLSPQPTQVVTSVVTSNGIAAPIGSSIRTEYDYEDAVYDGWRRRFRGFRKTKVTRVGDDTSPTTVTETTFHIDTCQDLSQNCLPLGQDNAFTNVLASLPVLTEVSDGKGTYLSSTSRFYKVVEPYKGLDGRSIRFAYASQTDSTLYDPTPTGDLGTDGATALVPWVSVNNEVVVYGSVPVRSKANPILTRVTMVLDQFGNITSSTDFGRPQADQARVTDTVMFPPRPDWQFLPHLITTHAFANGSGLPQGHDRVQRLEYDPIGNLRDVYGSLSGTAPLTRSHQVPGKQTAPPPTAASDSSIHDVLREHYEHDPWGNVIARHEPNNRVERFHKDTQYNQFTVVDETDTDTGSLATTRRFDRGLETVTLQTSPSGETTTMEYDGFGRLRRGYAADSVTGIVEGTPSLIAEYLLASPGTNVSRVHTQTRDGETTYRETWGYYDGFGQALASLQTADPSAGDQGQWIASGLPSHSANGAITRRYEPWFYSGSADAFLALPITVPTTAFSSVYYDAFGRVIANVGLDGSLQATRDFHALAVDLHDAEDLKIGGSHASTPSRLEFDGHGRVRRTLRTIHPPTGGVERIATVVSYESTGEANMVTQVHLGGPTEGPSRITRWMQYDSFGRMVMNVEPNTSNYIADPADGATLTAQVLRYAYNDNGDLVGTSDARGCGENFFYDKSGRLKAEDYSPCLAAHADWSQPNLDTGDGTEAFYRYDISETGTGFAAGRIGAVSDRGAHTRFEYDARGRVTKSARQIVKPRMPSDVLANRFPSELLSDRFAPWWFKSQSQYDEANRVVMQSSGADVPELMGAADNASNLVTTYSARGLVQRLAGSYGVLLDHSVVDADGLPLMMQYGDAASTMSAYGYDGRRRLGRYSVTRGDGPWVSGAAYNATTMQKRLVDDSFGYDDANNLTSIYDGRDASEWQPGAKPVSRLMGYDDLYRLTRVDQEYGTDSLEDRQTSSFDAEGTQSSAVPRINLQKRVIWQTFGYDWASNLVRSDDDTHTLWDRSIGISTMDATHPNQVKQAAGAAAQYDVSGNLVNLVLVRPIVACSTSACSQRFVYDWDEVGQLVRARRWDYAVLPTEDPAYPSIPAEQPAADLQYAYSAGQRVLKSATDATGQQRHSVEVFNSLRLNHARWDQTTGDYERSAFTESVYLAGLARVVVNPPGTPAPADGQHVLLMLGDQVSSSNVIIDRASGEVVERMVYQAYGAIDSDFRPERWGSFREDFRFTGKEEDIEVGLTYFGARYYSAQLGRWTSADPLTIHKVAADLNPYAYVRGSPLQLNDPSGFCTECGGNEPTAGPPPPPPPPPPRRGGGPTGCGQPGNGCGPGAPASVPAFIECDAACMAKYYVIQAAEDANRAAIQTTIAVVGANAGSWWRNAIVGAGAFAYGAIQGFTPGGMVSTALPLPENAKTPLFQFWQGAGQIAGGAMGISSGSSMVGGGGTIATLGTFFSGGTAAEVTIPVGAGAIILGAAQATNGVAAVGAGILNMAKANASSGGGQEEHEHHVFPREFREWFAGGERKLDIDEFVVDLPADAHLDQLHAQNIDTSAGPMNFKPGGIWNENWRQFINANPNATRSQVIDFGRAMCAGFGISGCP